MRGAPTPRGGGRGLQGAWMGSQLADRPIGQILLALAATLAAMPVTLQLLTWSFKRPYVIYINANSESVQLTTQDNAAASWFIEQATIMGRADTLPDPDAPILLSAPSAAAPPTEGSAPDSFSGCLEIGPYTEVSLRRQGTGALQISVNGQATPQREATPAVVLRPLVKREDGSVGTQCAYDHGVTALQQITLDATIGEQPLNGTLRGHGRIGGSPYFSGLAQSPPLLRGGEATVMGRRLLSDRAYTLLQAPLYLGDTLEVLGLPDQGGETALMTCLFSVQGKALDGGGIDLSCHANGRALSITRYGDRSRDNLAPRPWDVLINEPSIQVVLPLAITGLFVFVLRLLDGCYPWLCRRVGRQAGTDPD